mgnify:CR=1 FL=1
MRNNDLIATAVCAQYTPEQLHKLAAHYYTADEIASAAAKIIVEPGEDGTAPDPVEIAEETLCAALFHTFDGWKSPRNGGLSVKRGEKAVIRCKLWKYKDSPKPEDLPADADPLTQAAAEQGGGDYYMTTAYLFGRWQVEKREPKKPAEKRFKSLDDIRAYNKMLADQRKAAKAAARQDKPQTTAQPAPAPQQTNSPSTADLKKAADKAKREFMAVSEDDRPAQAAALEKWRKARKAAEDAKQTATAAAPATDPKPEAKPQPKAAPAASADSAPAYCEQTSFC